MKGYLKVFTIFLLTFLLLVNLGSAQIKNRIYVNRVNSVDGRLIEPAKAYFITRLQTIGFEVVYQRENADYLLDLNIVSVNSRRSFNWLIFLLPLWPIVPFTTVQGEAIVAIRIYDTAGNEVAFDQTGAVRNGMWFFGDFVSESSVIKRAVDDCINILIGRLNIK